MGICLGTSSKLAHVTSSQFNDSTSLATSGNLKKDSSKVELSASTSHLKIFTFNDLKNATRNFRSDSILGEGGFGYVFKGWIDEKTLTSAKPGTGTVVAVKKLKSEGFQGHREWLAEVNYLSQLHHENLVKLIGYCSESEHRLLVYEFMPKGCLENHLFKRRGQLLSWSTRIHIALDVARGLSFLHSLSCNVIYRDLKSSNILLDSDFNAKLSDFGLARDGPDGDKTHVSTIIIGTPGYAAPEYIALGRLTPKSDVYSFGVVLLELMSGKRALGDDSAGVAYDTLVEWARPFLSDNRRMMRIMDTRLGGQYSRKAALSLAALALQCLDLDDKSRPAMSEVLTTLEQLQTLNAQRMKPHARSRQAEKTGEEKYFPQKNKKKRVLSRLVGGALPASQTGVRLR
ncbi:hypothetical protein LIER_23658 [Lithospermum erythrorhizon]|uniref:non-specific serine/threonine protein kinase n=1 Tax=Lithospermum erythrorhizon TaxID=34254 RepID=A0AAV3QYJ4_LITER